jgi:sugar phosphate isomerase/epimerase
MDRMKSTSRRDFLKITALSGWGLFFRPGQARFSGKNESPFLQDVGVCTSLENGRAIRDSGCTYIEDGVGRLLAPQEPEEKFEANLKEHKNAGLPVKACNGFLPGRLKAVGPDPKHDEILVYAETALKRAARAGVEVLVWGSGQSRRIPDGFSRAIAEEQFCRLAKKTAGLARQYGVTLCLEPLNSGETNFINTLAEGAAVLQAVNQPNFKLLADIYHLLREGEAPSAIERNGKYLHHCHIAEKDQRTPPGVAGDDFRPFLKALRTVNYRGRISLECRWENVPEQLPAAVAFLRRQIDEIAKA